MTLPKRSNFSLLQRLVFLCVVASIVALASSLIAGQRRWRVSDDECDRLVGQSLQRGQAVRVDKCDVLVGVLLTIENAHGGLHL